jgi:hypothetical protein
MSKRRIHWSIFAAIAVPAIAGIVWLGLSDAPARYAAINAGALALALLWIAIGRAPETANGRRALVLVLLAILFAPLATGPVINGVARWLPLGPVTLHAGSLVIPAITVLAARMRQQAATILLVAILAALLQPDAASGFALTFAAVGLHHIGRDWKVGVAAIAGFFASIHAAINGLLPAQPYVERVLVELAGSAPLVALGLSAALVAGFLALVRSPGIAATERYALGGALFGFALMGWMSNYPSILIGYGASPILGFGIALGLRSRHAQGLATRAEPA